MAPVWEFLDEAGHVLRPKRSVSYVLRDLQQLKPFFYLSAVRDASREFQPRSAFWGPFLRNPTIPEDVRIELETQLDALNAKVIASDEKLRDVVTRLEKTGGIVAIGSTNAVTIEAVPGKARDLLSRVPVCSEVTHPFALKLTTLAKQNWLGRSVSDASAESSKLSL